MPTTLAELAVKIMVHFIPFLFALCFHEFAHGWVARRRGDNTALMMGRLTMNPLVHMDLVGTVILPLLAILNPGIGLFFGWAKPVPVNERNLRNPRVDMFWIALAGPLANLLLAGFSSFIIWIMTRTMITSVYFKPAKDFFLVFIGINLFLAVFNALPLHPLDGGKILARFLPPAWNDKLERNEHVSGLVLLFLILMGFTSFLVVPVNLLHRAFLFWA